MEVLVEAERKYMAKLSGAMAPVMIDAFFDLYAEAKKVSQGRKTLMQFQALLVEVKNWNNTIVKQHTDAIIKTCALFPNLLAAVFVISVKIMSAVRISSDSRKLNIKLPTNDVFVHSCYIAVAKDLYEDPYIVATEMKDSEKRAVMTQRITKCIKDIVEDFIPVQQILDTYIPGFTSGEMDIDHGVGADPADLPDAEEAPEPQTETEAAPAPDPAAEATEPAPETPALADESSEVKEVPVTPAPNTPAPVHQETLFDDAPEKK
jgi:hypothetical protein